jgi:hypothetical protein
MGAVVRRVRDEAHGGEFAVTDLVRQLSWLSIPPVVCLGRLKSADLSQGAVGRPGPQDSDHEADSQGIAAEKGHEPRHTGSHIGGVASIGDGQSTEVRAATRESVLQHWVGPDAELATIDARNRAFLVRVRVADEGHPLSVDDRPRLETTRPLLPMPKLDVEPDRGSAELAVSRRRAKRYLEAALEPPVAVQEHQPVVGREPRDLRTRGYALLLDLEEIREIGVQLYAEREQQRRSCEASYAKVVMERSGDASSHLEQERSFGHLSTGRAEPRVLKVQRRGPETGSDAAQQLPGMPRDGRSVGRKHARVLYEHAVKAVGVAFAARGGRERDSMTEQDLDRVLDSN